MDEPHHIILPSASNCLSSSLLPKQRPRGKKGKERKQPESAEGEVSFQLEKQIFRLKTF